MLFLLSGGDTLRTYSVMTTVKISPEQAEKLKTLSQQLGKTKGEVIRMAIEKLLSETEKAHDAATS